MIARLSKKTAVTIMTAVLKANAVLAFFRRLCGAYAETKSHLEYSVHW